MEGNSDVLPGLCLSQGISSILPIIVGAIRNGTSDEKEEALETLRNAIMLSCQQALQQNIYPITGPLLWLLLERMATSVHMKALKTLLLLLIKVSYGSFFDNIQNKTFIGSVWFPKVCQKLPIHSHFIKKKLRHNENRGVLLHRCWIRACDFSPQLHWTQALHILVSHHLHSLFSGIYDSFILYLQLENFRDFLPQLEFTFLWLLSDDSVRDVRINAAEGLVHVIKVHKNADDIFTSVHDLAVETTDPSIR